MAKCFATWSLIASSPNDIPHRPAETGILTFEPYKSALLPHWCFRTGAIAKESSSIPYQKFLEYYEDKDFPGMNIPRKFIQIGTMRSEALCQLQK